jgi:phage host-nuclease inhibitor protein Gam
MNAGRTIASAFDRKIRSRKEIEKMRLMNSSDTAGKNPMKRTVAHGKVVFRMSS